MAAIVVHGGAGRWPEAEREAAVGGVARAAAAGWQVLADGGSALDAVSAAVVSLEDDPLFNAGTGSVLNAAGEVEMDASIMAGETLASGGVACIMRVRNPVLVARRVLEATDCVLLAGAQATEFARAQGFGDHDPLTARRRAHWEQACARTARPEDDAAAAGTVGAVALDASGRLAAATSTGGRELKPPGRVGDSPVPGAGNYATPLAAVSATGHGELMLRAATAKAIADRIEHGATPEEAARAVLADMERRFGMPIGVIGLDAYGRIGVVHGTASMPHAFRRSGDTGVIASFAVAPANAGADR
jgi:beta-aspartyl-peptidase (threonine type)